MSHRWVLALVVAAGLSSAVALAGPAPTKRDAALQQPHSGTTRVIVRVQPGQSGAVADSLRRRGRSVVFQSSLIDAVGADAANDDLVSFDADPAVLSVSIDAPVASVAAGGPGGGSNYSGSNAGGGNPGGPGVATATVSPLLATLGLPVQGVTGKGVGVAVVDSGIAAIGDFTNLTQYDFTTDPAARNPYDDFGHGTHIAGLIAAKGALSNGGGGALYPGIAPNVRLISLKALDALGAGSTSAVIRAIEFAVTNRAALGIDVLNLSLGHPILERAATDPLVQAVEAAARAGIVVVVSAGNVGRNVVTGQPGYAGILSPGNAPSAITVGAVETAGTTSRGDDSVAAYSSRGPTWYDAEAKPDIVAPGSNLVSDASVGSTLYLQYPDRLVTVKGSNARFLRLSGTSMAAATATGVVALVIEASRTAHGVAPSPATVKAILEYTALALPQADPLTQGHGELNAAGAIALAAAIDPASALSSWTSASLPTTTVIGPDTLVWSQSWAWGDTVVWGNGLNWNDTVVWGNMFADGDTVVWGNVAGSLPYWAQTVVWGNALSWSDTVVWGNVFGFSDTVVWGNTLGWGDTVVWGNTATWNSL